MKIIRYGKQLHKIISDAIDGEGSEDYGPRIFDFSENGVNLKVKCEQQGDYITYVSSKFTLPKKIDGLTDDKIEEIYNSVIDLTSVIPTKSQDEIAQALDDHFFCKSTLIVEKKAEEIMSEVNNLNTESSSSNQPASSNDISDDENIKKLLADLDA